MKIIILSSIIILFTLVIGCGSSVSSKKEETVNDAPPKPVSSQPTTVKPNGSFVSIRIDSLIQSGTYDYRIYGQIVSALASPGMPGFAEPDQIINVAPEYFLAKDGAIALTEERNQKLLALRDAKPGDMFMGNISLHTPGGWVITRIEALMFNR